MTHFKLKTDALHLTYIANETISEETGDFFPVFYGKWTVFTGFDTHAGKTVLTVYVCLQPCGSAFVLCKLTCTFYQMIFSVTE